MKKNDMNGNKNNGINENSTIVLTNELVWGWGDELFSQLIQKYLSSLLYIYTYIPSNGISIFEIEINTN